VLDEFGASRFESASKHIQSGAVERLTDLFVRCLAVANDTRKAFMSALTSCCIEGGSDMAPQRGATARSLPLGSMGNRGYAAQHQHRLRRLARKAAPPSTP
jgi:hypothetical protein